MQRRAEQVHMENVDGVLAQGKTNAQGETGIQFRHVSTEQPNRHARALDGDAKRPVRKCVNERLEAVPVQMRHHMANHLLRATGGQIVDAVADSQVWHAPAELNAGGTVSDTPERCVPQG